MRIHGRKYVCSSLLKLSITNQLPFTFIVLLIAMSKKGKYMHQSSHHWGFQIDFQAVYSVTGERATNDQSVLIQLYLYIVTLKPKSL